MKRKVAPRHPIYGNPYKLVDFLNWFQREFVDTQRLRPVGGDAFGTEENQTQSFCRSSEWKDAVIAQMANEEFDIDPPLTRDNIHYIRNNHTNVRHQKSDPNKPKKGESRIGKLEERVANLEALVHRLATENDE